MSVHCNRSLGARYTLSKGEWKNYDQKNGMKSGPGTQGGFDKQKAKINGLESLKKNTNMCLFMDSSGCGDTKNKVIIVAVTTGVQHCIHKSFSLWPLGAKVSM